ncbi:MAG: TRAP transporter small permease subunit [Burkholderiales bacterium]
MDLLLKFSALIDRLNTRIGQAAAWLMLVAVLISAGNALVRYGLSRSSNAWLEIQWYLFGAMVMLGAAYTLKLNEHVRVDVLYSRYGERTRLWLDLLGGLFFLLPMTVIIGWLGWPIFVSAFTSGETSGNAGGLVKWPALLMIPLGFLLLSLQGVSEIIKRAAALAGRAPLDAAYDKPLQ